MLRPYRVHAGVLSGTQAAYDLVNLNGVEDDNDNDDQMKDVLVWCILT